MENHIFQQIEKEVTAMGAKGLFGVNHISGIYIPLIATATFIIGIFMAILNILQP